MEIEAARRGWATGMTRRGVLGMTLLAAWPLRAQPPTGPAPVRLRAERLAAGGVGFSGTSPGPILRARRNEAFPVEVENALERPLSVHWQGVRLDNAADGTAGLTEEPIAPGTRRTITFTPPDTGTFVYRADTAIPAEMIGFGGLSGVLVVADDAPPVADREMVLAVGAGPVEGAMRTLIGGRPEISLDVQPYERLRLRIANVSFTAACALRLSGLRPRVLAIDGQPCPAFPPLADRVVLPPCGRVDVSADMPTVEASISNAADGERPLVRLRPGAAPRREQPLAEPEALPDNPRLPREIPMRDAARATLVLGAEPGEGRTGPPLLAVRRERTVVLSFENRSKALFGVQLHGHAARLLDLMDDGWKPWWQDSLFVPPEGLARIAFIADNPGRWALDAMPLDGAEGVAPVAAWFEVS